MPDSRPVCDRRLAGPLLIDVATVGRDAEICDEVLAKGGQIAVSGRLVHRGFDSEQGAPKALRPTPPNRSQQARR